MIGIFLTGAVFVIVCVIAFWAGHARGYNKGYEEGYDEGYEDAMLGGMYNNE